MDNRGASCDEEWLQFCANNYEYNDSDNTKTINDQFEDLSNTMNSEDLNIPKSSDIYISTKTKIGYFNKELDLNTIFWNIHIIPYQKLSKGIIKKQMKVTTEDEDYIKQIENVVATSDNCDVLDLSKGKPKYIKKISIGTSKKDLVSYRTKKKGAFYNCFVLMFRIETDEGYKEMHVKFFNTGKIEIPGIKNDYLMDIVLQEINILFNDVLKLDIKILKDTFNTVLINSNFNCGYCVNRENLVDILKNKYCLSTSYDPCSYPGIMSKFYYDKELESIPHITKDYIDKKHTESSSVLSFMIFRTGSILIVGKCTEPTLFKIYEFIKTLLATEYHNVYQKSTQFDEIQQDVSNSPKKKIKRKNIKVAIDI